MSKVSYQVSSRDRIQTDVCLVSESGCFMAELPGQWWLPSVGSSSSLRRNIMFLIVAMGLELATSE